MSRIDASVFTLSPHEQEFVRDPFRFDLLPSGSDCAIPSGTGAIQPEIDPMHLDTLNAIDLGRLPAGRVSPEVAFYLRNSRSPKTIAGYRWGWSKVLKICARRRFCPLPMSEQTCCEIITELANQGLVIGSIRLILCSVNLAHAIAKEPSPISAEVVRSTVRGVARTFADRKIRRMAAVTPVELRLVYDRIQLEPKRIHAIRNWTVLITGFAGAFRRAELVALDTYDIDLQPDRIVVMVNRSKTDQEGRGATVVIHKATDVDLCPVRAMRTWLNLLPGPGPLFRPISSRGDHILPKRMAEGTVSMIVQMYAETMNLGDEPVASHSLRAGFVTAALENETPDLLVMTHTRHKTHESLAKYYRPRNSKINMTEHSGL